MSERPFTIKPMQPEEIAIAIDWAAAEGWHLGLCDAEFVFETARMYRGESTVFKVDRWFGVTTFELG